MKKKNWIWMPHAGHLCISDKCRFHLNTYVGKYIVSTVGEWWPDRIVREIHAEVHDEKWLKANKHLKGDYFNAVYFRRFGFHRIGSGKDDVYETMVFKAIKSGHKCCPYTLKIGGDVECIRHETAKQAYKGHLKLCRKWSKLKKKPIWKRFVKRYRGEK